MEQQQLGWLITNRSQVQFLPPAPIVDPSKRGLGYLPPPGRVTKRQKWSMKAS